MRVVTIIEDYIETIEKELNQVGCIINYNKGDIDVYDTVFIHIEKAKDLDVVHKIFSKYNFRTDVIVTNYYPYYKKATEILAEIRFNALKELIR